MKKLCALMLTLLLVVPVLAMAEKVPAIDMSTVAQSEAYTIGTSDDTIKYVQQIGDLRYEFRYRFNGVLVNYTCMFPGGFANYAPSGELSESAGNIPETIVKFDPVINKNTTTALADLSEILKEKKIGTLEAFYAGAVPAESILINDNTVTVMDETVDWIAAGDGNYPIRKPDLDNSYTADVTPKYIAVKKGALVSLFRNNSGTITLEKVYADSLSYYVKGGFTHMRGDKTYTDARYDVEGKREHYFLYSSDMNVKTAYDDKNRLVSHETWLGKAYWCFEEGAWWTSAEGDPFDTKLATEVPENVLKSRLLTDAVAQYSVGKPLTSVGQLDEENEGLPFIVSSDVNLKNAAVDVESKLIDETTTRFNITPTSGGAAVQPASGTKLYLPLPAGMDADIAAEHDITVTHNGEVFSTIDGTATITKQGVLVNATSYSPYTVIWGDKATQTYNANAAKDVQKLPSTGDNSNMLICLAMLAASGAMLLSLRKKAA